MPRTQGAQQPMGGHPGLPCRSLPTRRYWDFVVAKGDLLTLICAMLWACQILIIDHVAGKGDPIRIACLQFSVCAVLSAVSGLLFEHCTVHQIAGASGAVAYAGIMSVGIAFTLQVVCQKRCPPAPAAIIMSLEAVFAAWPDTLFSIKPLAAGQWPAAA